MESRRVAIEDTRSLFLLSGTLAALGQVGHTEVKLVQVITSGIPSGIGGDN